MGVMKEFESSSTLFGANAPFIEELYEKYLADPASVDAEWRAYFDELRGGAADVPHAPVVASFVELAKNRRMAGAMVDATTMHKQVLVLRLISKYRTLGMFAADLDPLKQHAPDYVADLDLRTYGFTDADMDTEFDVGSYKGGPARMRLRDLVVSLQETYTRTLGAEYMYITDTATKRFFQDRLEPIRSRPDYSPEQRRHILERLTAAETLERYLHTKYVGQKRFSGEGGDTMIPMLDLLVSRAGATGVGEIVLGMAHRGRLNVLVNILGKMPANLFSEFEGKAAQELPAGDVKYHQGFSSDVSTPGGPVHLTLAFNPSHLEIVNPVVEGSVRARQHRRGDTRGDQVLPILIHGDAAIAGQGVNQECLNMAQTRGYYTGGTIHIVVNNQIGFTTSDPRDARGTTFCTDIAKMVDAPVLHVNGDDPEVALLAVEIALEYRQRFHRDVFIDLVCFRRLGPQRGGRADGHAAAHVQARRAARRHAQALRGPPRGGGRGVAGGRRRDGRRVSRRDGPRPAHEQDDPVELQAAVHDRLVAVHRRALDGPRRHHGADGDAQGTVRAADDVSRGLQGAPARREGDRRPARDGRGRAAARLGNGRDARVRHSAPRRLRRAPVRRGHRPRHVLAPPRGAARPEPRALGRGHVRAAPAPRARAADVRDHRLRAHRAGGGRLRVRLLDVGSGAPRRLGGAVRRLRQRRAGRHRPVHQRRRSEVGPHLRPRDAAAPRLRRPGPGAFVRASGALPAAVRAAQHAGVRAVDARAGLPHAAPADAAQLPEAADRDEPEEPAPAQGGGVVARRSREGRLLPRDRRDGEARRRRA